MGIIPALEYKPMPSNQDGDKKVPKNKNGNSDKTQDDKVKENN